MVFDFRLKVFYVVAEKLSFTKAAGELFITQPAVTRHIGELESQLDARLFDRNGNSIALTPAGQILMNYARRIFGLYAELENELAQLRNISSGTLRLGASTTLAQYVLPEIIAAFRKMYPLLHINLLTGNTAAVESHLLTSKIDMALVEGVSRDVRLSYEPFAKDEVVLVARTGSRLFPKSEIRAEQLYQVPLVFREHGSGTLDAIYRSLQKAGVDTRQLKTDIHLDSTESIKRYILSSDSAAFLSLHAISKELRQNELSIIDIKGVEIPRTFQFIHLQGQISGICMLFKRFCLSHYNLK